jgi:hypothetical protein
VVAASVRCRSRPPPQTHGIAAPGLMNFTVEARVRSFFTDIKHSANSPSPTPTESTPTYRPDRPPTYTNNLTGSSFKVVPLDQPANPGLGDPIGARDLGLAAAFDDDGGDDQASLRHPLKRHPGTYSDVLRNAMRMSWNHTLSARPTEMGPELRIFTP